MKSDRTRYFLDIFTGFMSETGLKVAGACRRIGVSRSLFYEIRDRERDATEKMISRLEKAAKEEGVELPFDAHKRRIATAASKASSPEEMDAMIEEMERLENEMAKLKARMIEMKKQSTP